MNVPQDDLSIREKDVLSYLSKGLQNKEIAKILQIAEHTVEQHLSRIYRKLGVSNRIEASMLYLSHYQD